MIYWPGDVLIEVLGFWAGRLYIYDGITTGIVLGGGGLFTEGRLTGWSFVLRGFWPERFLSTGVFDRADGLSKAGFWPGGFSKAGRFDPGYWFIYDASHSLKTANISQDSVDQPLGWNVYIYKPMRPIWSSKWKLPVCLLTTNTYNGNRTLW